MIDAWLGFVFGTCVGMALGIWPFRPSIVRRVLW